MGKNINVDLQRLSMAQKAVESYAESRKAIVKKMRSAVDNASTGWQGEDEVAFVERWNGMFTADGVMKVAGDNIDNYAKLLKKANDLYRKAQSESVDQVMHIKGST